MAKQCLKNKLVKRGLFTNKTDLLSISLLSVWVVLFVKNVGTPIYSVRTWNIR